MKKVLATQNDGVAIAAPQIGESYRLFVVAPFIFEEPEKEHLVYINPIITEHSDKTKWKHEGCLSCRWKVGEVKRSIETVVEAYDEHGNKFTEYGDG
jgi:peptide deformylase